MIHGEPFVTTHGTYKTLQSFVISLDMMELHPLTAMQHLDKEVARYGLMMLNVEEMRKTYRNAVTVDGEFTAVDIMKTLVWFADLQVKQRLVIITYYHINNFTSRVIKALTLKTPALQNSPFRPSLSVTSDNARGEKGRCHSDAKGFF